MVEPATYETAPSTGKADHPAGVAPLYEDKPADYFDGSRPDIVSKLRTSSDAAILEIGCGAGGTGRAALAAGKAGRYVGIELNQAAARLAQAHLSEVLVGNVESLDLGRFAGAFDALIISEVLEHLIDPWQTVRRLSECLKPNGVVYASSPNVAHWQVLRELVAGRFQYEEAGVMDRTHVRWFTPGSYAEMFTAAGFAVEHLEPLTHAGWKARLLNRLTAGRFAHLFSTQIMLVARKC
jgi:2-polyprenyl-3-methyl-5-hydroxy-6-metoxy-1,4-benzoquinol methylase